MTKNDIGLAAAAKRKRPTFSVTMVIGVPKHDRRAYGGRPGYPPSDDEEEEEEVLPDEEQEEVPPEGEEQDTAEPAPEEQDNQRIYEEAVRALRGESRHPSEALNEFIAVFGRQSLEQLRKELGLAEGGPVEEEEFAAGGRMVRGPGRGMDDRISASVGDQPVLLSDGEFVIPADVVSMLGDGSSDAGERILAAMMARVRRAKSGKAKQAKALDPGNVLPV